MSVSRVQENCMHGSMRRREEPRPVGYAVRPWRLPPTLPPSSWSPRAIRPRWWRAWRSQAIYRVPRPRRPPQRRPPVDAVERAVVAEALAHPTDGYRMVTAWARRRLGQPVNRKKSCALGASGAFCNAAGGWTDAGGRGSSASSGPTSSGTST